MWTALFEKEPWKVRVPGKANRKPRRNLGIHKISFVSSSPYEFENTCYSNISWKTKGILKIPCVLKIFSKPRLHKNSLATGVKTNADSQWNPVCKLFHRIRCCGNETVRWWYCKRDLDAKHAASQLKHVCGKQTSSDWDLFFRANLLCVPDIKM